MRKAFSVNSALHSKADVRCKKLKCQELAQTSPTADTPERALVAIYAAD